MQLEQIESVFRYHSENVWPGRSRIVEGSHNGVWEALISITIPESSAIVLVSAMEIQIRVQIVSKVDFDSKPGIVTTRPMSGGLLPASVLSLGGTLIQVSNMLDQIHALEAD